MNQNPLLYPVQKKLIFLPTLCTGWHPYTCQLPFLIWTILRLLCLHRVVFLILLLHHRHFAFSNEHRELKQTIEVIKLPILPFKFHCAVQGSWPSRARLVNPLKTLIQVQFRFASSYWKFWKLWKFSKFSTHFMKWQLIENFQNFHNFQNFQWEEAHLLFELKEGSFTQNIRNFSSFVKRWRVVAGRRRGGKNSSHYFIKYLSRLIMLKMYRKCTDAPFTPFLIIEMSKYCLA